MATVERLSLFDRGPAGRATSESGPVGLAGLDVALQSFKIIFRPFNIALQSFNVMCKPFNVALKPFNVALHPLGMALKGRQIIAAR